jgi:DNA-binding NarL/FixJ family response regulator
MTSMAPPARTVSQTTSVEIRVLVYDRSNLMRAALSQFIDSQPDLVICGTTGVPERAVRDTVRLDPDVVVLGLSFERPILLLRLVADIRAAHPGARILVLSLTDWDPSARGVREAGGLGCVGKYESADRVLAGIRSVAVGHPYGVPVG